MDQKLSVFHLFSELFPEYANDKDRDGGTTGTLRELLSAEVPHLHHEKERY